MAINQKTRNTRWAIVDDVVRGLKREGYSDDEAAQYIAAQCFVKNVGSVEGWVSHKNAPTGRYVVRLVELYNELYPNKPTLSVHVDSRGSHTVIIKPHGDGPEPYQAELLESKKARSSESKKARSSESPVEGRTVLELAKVKAFERMYNRGQQRGFFAAGFASGVFFTLGLCVVAYALR